MNRSEAAAYLRGHDNYLILTHRRPDGDTLGSAAVLCRLLRKLGKTAHILQNPEITPKYQFLHDGLTVQNPGLEDTLVCVDVASANMLPDSFAPLESRIALRIDHHGTAQAFTPLSLVDAQAGACGEILYDLMELLGLSLDKDTALALYTAVSTDTGCFRFANTTAHTFTVAAACARAAGDLSELNQMLFETNSLAKLRMQGYLAENARFLRNGEIAVCPIPLSVERAMGVTEDDMENISGFPRTIAGVSMAATLRQLGENRTKLSVRAAPGYNAAAVCERFGGGGHRGAAGATLPLPLEQAAQEVGQAMLEML